MSVSSLEFSNYTAQQLAQALGSFPGEIAYVLIWTEDKLEFGKDDNVRDLVSPVAHAGTLLRKVVTEPRRSPSEGDHDVRVTSNSTMPFTTLAVRATKAGPVVYGFMGGAIRVDAEKWSMTTHGDFATDIREDQLLQMALHVKHAEDFRVDENAAVFELARFARVPQVVITSLHKPVKDYAVPMGRVREPFGIVTNSAKLRVGNQLVSVEVPVGAVACMVQVCAHPALESWGLPGLWLNQSEVLAMPLSKNKLARVVLNVCALQDFEFEMGIRFRLKDGSSVGSRCFGPCVYVSEME